MLRTSGSRGGWSSEGVKLIDDISDGESVVCHSYHLTSFAVLVSIHEPEKVYIYAL